MDSLPKLDTATGYYSNSVRNSYASATDENPRSARSSYGSISDINTASSRSSYSSITDQLGRVASFSRTSDSFIPDSVESTPVTSRDPSPDSLRWNSQESVMLVDQTTPRAPTQVRPRSHSKVGSTDGPTALRQLQNVKNVICVAFGAFDRYYISWEDNEGEFHQESHKLPESLYNWLFPATGETRHLPTLQVSFGSNDDFFASDQEGKLSNRDATPPVERKPAPPRLANVARGFMRRKAHTVSSPKPAEEVLEKSEDRGMPPRMERRNTLLEGQASPHAEEKQTLMPLSLSLHIRRDSRGGSVPREQTIIPLSMALHARRESRSEMPRITEQIPFQPTSSEASPPALDLQAERAKAEKRRSMYIAAERQSNAPEPIPEIPQTEQLPPSLDTRAELAKAERRRSLFIAERQAPQTEEVSQISPPEQQQNITPVPGPQLIRLDSRPELARTEQRRSNVNIVPPVRPSWPERKTLFMNRERILSNSRENIVPTSVHRSSYVDACVQTEITDAEICEHLSSLAIMNVMPVIPLPPRHSVSIGGMSDFFRGQYSLGDALRYV